MKFNFKKIASVLASTVMLSSTVALAAAANYPSPFVKNGVADVAVVFGAAAPGNTDMTAAVDITNNLNSKLVAGTSPTTVSGGDFVQLERTTDEFNLGDEMDDFYASLDDEELSIVLESGIYQNDDNEEFDFEQSITLSGGLGLEHFADSDLDEDEVPVIGFNLNDGDTVLNYTLEFIDSAEAGGVWTAGNALETTEITMLGRTYYVVSARNTSGTNHKLTLLDTANSATITEGESSTISVGGTNYDVSIGWVDSDEAILNVNGVETNKLGEGDVYKVGTDLYLGLKDILYNEKDTGISKVSVSLGSGKIVIENNQEVQINNEDVSTLTDSELNGYIDTDSNDLESVTLEWILDDDAWIVPGKELLLPGFETIKLSMGGFVTETKEVAKVTPDGDDSMELSAEIKDGSVSLNLFYLNSSNTGILGLGEKSSHKLVTGAAPSVLLNTSENSYFVATWVSGDDAESYAFEIQSIEDPDNDGKNKTTLKNLADSTDLVFSEVGKIKDVGSLQLKLAAANEVTKIANITIVDGTGSEYMDRIVTQEGLRIRLPVDSATATTDGYINLTAVPTSWNMNFTEETKDGDIQLGDSVKATIAVDGDDGLEVTTLAGVTMVEDGDDTDNYVGYVVSELATKFWQSKPSTGLNELEVEYHGEEVSADVYISESGAAVVSAEAGAKVIPIKDSEVASVTAKNLIVVGGSCINTEAARLLGGALCGADFEAATGVGAGSFLIQTFANGADGVATLVAGYNAEDTTNAARYLTTQTVDTTAGKKYKGTTSSSAELVVA